MPNIAVWPFEANAADEVVEEYGWMTSVIGSYHGPEQRIQLKRHPVGSIEFSYLLDDVWEAQRANALLYRKHAQPWAVPLWQYATRGTTDVAIGATQVDVVTANLPFTDGFDLGPYAILWQSARAFELIELNAVHGAYLELAVPTVGAWTKATTRVIPVRVARIADTFEVGWDTSRVASGRIRFEFDAWRGNNVVPRVSEDFVEEGGEAVPLAEG